MAASVSQQSAQTIALNFYKANAHPANTSNLTAALTYTRQETDGTIDFYVFNIQPGPGFVIVSADDNFKPVVGYSTESFFDSNLNKTGVVNWMANTAQKIYNGIQAKVQADATIKTLWQSYASGINPVSSRSTGIGPLLTTSWNQSPYYNYLCPSSQGQNAVTGCVATAMAQILKYWSYPKQGVGSYEYDDAPPQFSTDYGELSANFGATTYDWSAMPNVITSDNVAVGTLMYQCGVSVAMDYGPDESGAWVLQSEAGPGNPCAQNSYTTYFSYDPTTLSGVHQNQYSLAAWETLLENELNIGRVIQYEGTDPQNGGHTWVCDGYDANNMFHMNWGWGSDDDGYFEVTNLNPSPYDFSEDDAALIGIQPISAIKISVSATTPLICKGDNTSLVATGPQNATYSWTPTTGLSCATCASTTANPTTTTTYTVTVDSGGITAKAFTTVTVGAAVIPQFSIARQPGCTLPVSYVFTNTSANATNYIWSYGDGSGGNTVNPTHTYSSAGTDTVMLIATNGCYTDTTLQTIQVQDDAPVVPNVNMCKGQSVTLNASGPGSISWYADATGGTAFQTGNSYTTPVLNSNVTYYVSSSITAPQNYAGPTDNTFGSGSYFNNTNQHSVIFNCSVPQTLQTVDVYAGSSGNRTIQLLDSTGDVLSSIIVDIPSGHQTVDLNFSLPAGDNMYLAVSGNVDLYRNKVNAAYPYYSSDSTVILTGSDAGVPGYYYYFYNWVLQQPACTTDRTPVTVDVTHLTSSINATSSGADSSTVTFTPVNTAATKFLWNFGVNDATSTEESPTYTYPGDGIYNVALIESNAQCSDTLDYTLGVGISTGISSTNLIADWSLFPNPTRDVLNLDIQSGQDAQNCQLNIYNMLGEKVATQTINLNSGANTLQLNVAQLAPAMYIISLQSGSSLSTRRFSKVE